MTIAFIESPTFPDELAAWAVGGRGSKTTIVETYGGDEYRNSAWTQQRGEWEMSNAWRNWSPANAAYNVSVLRNFARATRGMLGAFRFRNFAERDYADEGGGVFVMLTSTTFQMYKRYTVGGQTYDQIIQKPRGSIAVTGGSGASVGSTTGICTVASGTPTAWVGEYDVPVRLAQDMPKIGLDESTGALYNWQSLKLIEVRNPG